MSWLHQAPQSNNHQQQQGSSQDPPIHRSLWRRSLPAHSGPIDLNPRPPVASGGGSTGHRRYSAHLLSLAEPCSPTISSTFLEIDEDSLNHRHYSHHRRSADPKQYDTVRLQPHAHVAVDGSNTTHSPGEPRSIHIRTRRISRNYSDDGTAPVSAPIHTTTSRKSSSRLSKFLGLMYRHQPEPFYVQPRQYNREALARRRQNNSRHGNSTNTFHKRSDSSGTQTMASTTAPANDPNTENHISTDKVANENNEDLVLEPFSDLLSPPSSPVSTSFANGDSPPPTSSLSTHQHTGRSHGQWHDGFDVKRHFLVTLAEAMIKFGSPTYRIEYLLRQTSSSLKVHMRCSMLPNLLLMTYESPVTHATETIILTIAQGYDLDKLFHTNLLCDAIAKKTITIETAIDRLEYLIDSPSNWRTAVVFLASVTCSLTASPLLFNGSIADALLSAVLSATVVVLSFIANRSESFSYLYEIAAAIMVSILTILFRVAVNTYSLPTIAEGTHVCFTGVALSSLIQLLPGLTIATSFVDINSKNIISGAVRMIYGFVRMLSLAFGLVMGVKLMRAVNPQYVDHLFDDCDSTQALSTRFSPWLRIPLLVVLSLSLSIRLRASPRQFDIMMVTIFAAFWANWGFSEQLQLGNETTAAASALIVGIIANIYSRVTRHPGLAPLLGGISLLVPGGLGVRSSLSMLEHSPNTASGGNDPNSGASLVMTMIVVAFSLSLGVLASNFIRPIEGHLKTSRIVQLRRKIAEEEAKERAIMEAAESATSIRRQGSFLLRRLTTRRRRPEPTNKQNDSGVDKETGDTPTTQLRRKNTLFRRVPTTTTTCETDLSNNALPVEPISFGTLTVSDATYMQERERHLVKLRLWLRRWEWQRRAGKQGKREKAKVEKWLRRYETLRLTAQRERDKRAQQQTLDKDKSETDTQKSLFSRLPWLGRWFTSTTPTANNSTSSIL